MVSMETINNIYHDYRIKVYGFGFNTLAGLPLLLHLFGEQGLAHLLAMQSKRTCRGNQKESYKFKGYRITFYVK